MANFIQNEFVIRVSNRLNKNNPEIPKINSEFMEKQISHDMRYFQKRNVNHKDLRYDFYKNGKNKSNFKFSKRKRINQVFDNTYPIVTKEHIMAATLD